MCSGNGNLLTTSATNTTSVVSPTTALEQFQQTFGITNESVASTMLSGKILIDFSLTVKAATLIFISGRGSAISSAKEGKSGFIYSFVKSK